MSKAIISGTKYSPTRDKWSLVLEVRDNKELAIGQLESAYLFNSQSDAVISGFRAIRVLEETGSFPNMCEAF